MSLGPLMIDIAGTELTSEDIKVLSHPLVGSVILFTRNYRDIAQLTALTAAIRAQRSPQLLIAVDHEGGRVQRFREGFTRLPPARLLGRRYDQDRREALNLAQSVGWLMAGELRAVGVDFSFAPCVDLDYGVSEIIGDRAFHKDPDVVAALGIAYMAGMREAGMAAVAKHFPGHGAVIADSHVALPVDRRKYADLEPDIRPYRPLIDNNLAAVMGAHVVFPAVDALPASLSQRWITGVLRR
jgi:beta-N-acetylhexosaminidase